MAGFEGQALLRAWEAGEPLRGDDRALAILATVAGTPVEELARYPLGRRDAMLLGIHSGLSGRELAVLADCAGCATPLEVPLKVDDLVGSAASNTGEWRELDLGTATVRARPPSTADLAALTGPVDPVAIRAALVSRCVSEVRPDRPLSTMEVGRLAELLQELDPLSDVWIEVTCAECATSTLVFLDVPALVWAGLRVRARHLVADVGALAARYGWAEADILAMSPARRRMYLELP
jgi:hypothetical protein